MFKRILHIVVFTSVLLGLFMTVPATPAYAADTWTVTKVADTDDGTCDADCSLREALAAAASGDTIDFDNTFSIPQTITLTSTLDINKDITITGTGSDIVSISGDDTYRVFFIFDPYTVNISGLTIRDGYNVSHGGGVYNFQGVLTLNDVVLTENVSDSLYSHGGGVYVGTGASLAMTNSQVTLNQAHFGSGIGCHYCNNISLTNVVISDNNDVDYDAYTSGGGISIRLAASASSLNGVLIDGNTAGSGGGLYIQESSATIENSTVSGNTVETSEGGGGVTVSNSGGQIVTMNNVTISGNQAIDSSAAGGGVDQSAGTLNLNNVTIASNTAGSFSGGIRALGTVNLSNTIIADNTSTNTSDHDCVGTLNSLDYNLIEDADENCAISGTTTNNITGQDPHLNPLALVNGYIYLHTLQSNSPAIDEGDNSTCETSDQRYIARPVGPYCDMGAYEYATSSGVVTTTLNDEAGSLRFVVEHIVPNDPTTYGTVTFDPGLAGATIEVINSPINLFQNILINGSSLNITIDGNDASQLFFVDPSTTAFLQNLNLIDGSGVDGGAINNYGNLAMSNMNFVGNTATDEGGAIYNVGQLVIQSSKFTSNSANSGGGAIANFYGDIEINDSSFTFNTSDGVAGHGGAIYIDGGTGDIRTSLFDGNIANGGLGGAIYYTGDTLSVANSTFSANSTPDGMGSAIYGHSPLTITNSTLSGNVAAGVGNWGGTLAFDNDLYLYNTIIANSSGGVWGDCYNNAGSIVDNVNNLIEDNTCSPTLSGDPMLGPLQDNGGPTLTFALLTGSPAIDAGDDTVCAASPVNNESQNGVTRPQGSHCDIGAFEMTIFRLFLPLILR